MGSVPQGWQKFGPVGTFPGGSTFADPFVGRRMPHDESWQWWVGHLARKFRGQVELDGGIGEWYPAETQWRREEQAMGSVP